MNEPVSNHRIKEAIESLPRDNPAMSEVVMDCLFALRMGAKHNEGAKYLEDLFSNWLWTDEEPSDERHLAYVIALGQLEEMLVAQGLIYTDRRQQDRPSDTN